MIELIVESLKRLRDGSLLMIMSGIVAFTHNAFAFTIVVTRFISEMLSSLTCGILSIISLFLALIALMAWFVATDYFKNIILKDGT